MEISAKDGAHSVLFVFLALLPTLDLQNFRLVFARCFSRYI